MEQSLAQELRATASVARDRMQTRREEKKKIALQAARKEASQKRAAIYRMGLKKSEKIISELNRRTRRVAARGGSSLTVMELTYEYDFLSPRSVTKPSRGPSQYAIDNWLRSNNIVLSPQLLCGAGKIVYSHCVRNGLQVVLKPCWRGSNYDVRTARYFKLVVSW